MKSLLSRTFGSAPAASSASITAGSPWSSHGSSALLGHLTPNPTVFDSPASLTTRRPFPPHSRPSTRTLFDFDQSAGGWCCEGIRVPRRRGGQGVPTFARVCETVIAIHAENWREDGRNEEHWRATLTRYVLPRIGDRPVNAVVELPRRA